MIHFEVLQSIQEGLQIDNASCGPLLGLFCTILECANFLNHGTTRGKSSGYHPHGDWQLRVLVGDEVLDDRIISYANVSDEWLELEYDLTKYAGQHAELSIENSANDWKNEFGYWSYIKIFSE